MARTEPSAFTPEHIAQFHRHQAFRLQTLRKMGDVMQVWRDCADKACQRSRSCRRSDAACLHAFMQALPDEDRRLIRYALEFRRDGLGPDAAIELAQARVAGEIARGGG